MFDKTQKHLHLLTQHQFLDWAKYPEWTKGNVISIEPLENKQPSSIVRGDRLKVVFEGGMKATAEVSVCINMSLNTQQTLTFGRKTPSAHSVGRAAYRLVSLKLNTLFDSNRARQLLEPQLSSMRRRLVV
jgi:hypothetical protein